MNFNLRGWLEIDSQGDRLVALVLPASRSNFPSEWFVRPRGSLLFRLQSLSAQQLQVVCQHLPGFLTSDTHNFGDAALLEQAWSGLERGHLLVLEAPRGQFQSHVFTLLTARPTGSHTGTAGAGAAGAAGVGVASAAAETASAKPKAVPRAPEPTSTIKIHLIDHEKKSIPSAACRLVVEGGRVIAGAFDAQGMISQSYLTVGTCRFTLPGLHRSRWSTVSGGGSETVVTSSRSDHRIQAGESIARLAIPQGYTIDEVWNHAGNQALRERRGHPNQLVPGDVVAFPPLQTKELLLATNMVHVFKRHQEPTTFVAVQFFDGDAPRADQSWSFKPHTGESLSGTSDADGVVTLAVPAFATGGFLTLGGKQDDEQEEPQGPGKEEKKSKPQVELLFDRLHSIGEPEGVRQRLANLGFWWEIPDQAPTERLTAAVRSFQVRVGLDPSGKIDDPTKQKLAEIHDRRGALPAEPAIKHKA